MVLVAHPSLGGRNPPGAISVHDQRPDVDAAIFFRFWKYATRTWSFFGALLINVGFRRLRLFEPKWFPDQACAAPYREMATVVNNEALGRDPILAVDGYGVLLLPLLEKLDKNLIARPPRKPCAPRPVWLPDSVAPPNHLSLARYTRHFTRPSSQSRN
jgi:hypothetical protein